MGFTRWSDWEDRPGTLQMTKWQVELIVANARNTAKKIGGSVWVTDEAIEAAKVVGVDLSDCRLLAGESGPIIRASVNPSMRGPGSSGVIIVGGPAYDESQWIAHYSKVNHNVDRPETSLESEMDVQETEAVDPCTLINVGMEPQRYKDLVQTVRDFNPGFILGVGANSHEAFEAVVFVAPDVPRDQLTPLIEQLLQYGKLDFVPMDMDDVESLLEMDAVQDFRSSTGT